MTEMFVGITCDHDGDDHSDETLTAVKLNTHDFRVYSSADPREDQNLSFSWKCQSQSGNEQRKQKNCICLKKNKKQNSNVCLPLKPMGENCFQTRAAV